MNLKEILLKNEFKFNKRFGQNFISDTNLLKMIVEKAGVNSDSNVIEIGLGGGTLTSELAKVAKKVYGYEIDNNLKPILGEVLAGFDNVEIKFCDIMRQETADIENFIGEKYMVVANLPYYITTPIIMKFIEEAKNVTSIVVMVQLEVAERICAKENTAEYGAITANINAIANSKIIARVNRNMFFPVPNVDSAVLQIDLDREKFEIFNKKIYRDVVRSAFINRRKMLVNNLMQSFKLDRTSVENLLLDCDIDLKARGESLSIAKLVQLSNKISDF